MRTSKADKLHAKRWKCAPTTIQNWRKSGAPLAGTDAEMEEFLHTQRTLPVGTGRLLEKAAHRPINVDKMSTLPEHTAETLAKEQADQKSGPPVKRGRKAELGAEHALSRLEVAEEDADDRLRVALEAGMPGAIKAARQHWLSIVRELRAYDESVESFRRRTGDHVDRQAVEECVTLLCSLWVSLCGATCHAVSGRLLEAKEPAEIVSILHEWFTNRVAYTLAGFGGVTLGTNPKVTIPTWMTGAVQRGFSQSCFTSGVSPRAEKIQKLIQLLLEEDDRTALQLIQTAST